MLEVVALLIGYLLGSVSPAYFPGRLFKGIDIRKHGGHFAGTTNVYHVLGSLAAAATELLPLGVDDNFSIPLISAATMTVVTIF